MVLNDWSSSKFPRRSPGLSVSVLLKPQTLNPHPVVIVTISGRNHSSRHNISPYEL